MAPPSPAPGNRSAVYNTELLPEESVNSLHGALAFLSSSKGGGGDKLVLMADVNYEHSADYEFGGYKLVLMADVDYEHGAMSSLFALSPLTCGKGGKTTAKPTTSYQELDNAATLIPGMY